MQKPLIRSSGRDKLTSALKQRAFRRLVWQYKQLGEKQIDVRMRIRALIDQWVAQTITSLRLEGAQIPIHLSWEIDVEPCDLFVGIMFFVSHKTRSGWKHELDAEQCRQLYNRLKPEVQLPLAAVTGLDVAIDVYAPPKDILATGRGRKK